VVFEAFAAGLPGWRARWGAIPARWATRGVAGRAGDARAAADALRAVAADPTGPRLVEEGCAGARPTRWSRVGRASEVS